jgi:uncharacterized Zn finger protein (UPF0148 family)
MYKAMPTTKIKYEMASCPACGVHYGITSGTQLAYRDASGEKVSPKGLRCPNGHRWYYRHPAMTIFAGAYQDLGDWREVTCPECGVPLLLSVTYLTSKTGQISCPMNHLMRAAQPGGAVQKTGPRIGDADRDEAITRITAGFATGHLTQDEMNDRMSTALAAVTRNDLTALTSDLPAVRETAARRRRPVPALALYIGICVICTVTGLIAIFFR